MKLFKPHAYQVRAENWVKDKPKSGLFMDMGLGKTIVVFTAIDALIYDWYDVSKVLVIAPKRVAEETWITESKKWAHLNNLSLSIVSGNATKRKQALEVDANIYVISRDNVVWLVDLLGTNWDFDTVVIDELSSFKSESTNRFKALRKVIGFSKRVIGLTGTPAPNGLLDLWSQIYLLDGGKRLGRTFQQYRDRFFTPSGYITTERGSLRVKDYVLKRGAEEKIWSLISDICLSMKSEDYLDLPPYIPNIISVRLPTKAKNDYDKLERDLILNMGDSDIVAGSAAALSNKLLQASSGSIYDEFGQPKELHTALIDALKDTIEAAQSNVLVFYNFKHDLAQIQKHFPNAVVLKTGDHIRDWNAGKIPILLAHPASAGHGLNLQDGGNHAIWYGLTWNLENFQQANKRLHRQGQKKRVTITFLIAKDTLAENVYQRLTDKAETQDGLMVALSERKALHGRS